MGKTNSAAANAKAGKASTKDNPLLAVWRSRFQSPPFSRIAPEHFPPAFAALIKEHKAAISAIARNERRPSFANTIAELEKCAMPLARICGVFFNLLSADSNSALQAIERDIAPKLAAHYSAIYANQALFKRVDEIYDRRDRLNLDKEQLRVLERHHLRFVRAGARLKPKDRKRVIAINERIAELVARFRQNVLADEQSWHMALSSEKQLAGLPERFRSAARQAARDLGLEGDNVHAITLARTSVEEFLTYSDRRDLREQAFKAWISRGQNGGKTDNRDVLGEVVQLRGEYARLLGYDTYADYVLDDTMAKSPAAARGLLDAVWAPACLRACEERDDLAELARADGKNFKIKPWDWRYYAEKQRLQRFDLSDAELRPYFKLENIIEAAFATANRLFGLEFTPLTDIDLYHRDVRAFDVTDKKGNHVALFLGDYFSRPSKRSGAWCSRFRPQYRLTREVRPIVLNVLNFAKGGEGEPALISFEDARTLFHEFGHALHTMLSDVTYPSISGTAVARDFVELPSQLFEHWIAQGEVLREFATHFKTGKPIPQRLLKRLKAARNFNQGFATVEYTASAIADLELHSLADATNLDIEAFEKATLKAISMPDEIVMRHRLPHFQHIVGGYSAGYYSYLWSEVMDADAFSAFEEAGDIFDPKVARRLKTNIYASGNKRDPHDAYKAFRGRAPQVGALLAKRGFA